MNSDIIVEDRSGAMSTYYDSAFYLPHILNYDVDFSSSPAVVIKTLSSEELVNIPEDEHSDEEISKKLNGKEKKLGYIIRENGSGRISWVIPGAIPSKGNRIFWRYPTTDDVKLI